jgi:isocitrate lyase
MSVQEAISIMNSGTADMFMMMKAKRVIEALGPVQGQQETQMEREGRELRSLPPMTPEQRQAAVNSWKGVADQLSRDYN